MNMNVFPFSLYAVLDVELYVVLGILGIGTYLFYKFLLKRVTHERHLNIQTHLKRINRHFLLLTLFYAVYLLLYNSVDGSFFIKKILPYLASVTYVFGIVYFVRVCRLNVLMYLFLGSMTAGVPLLLVNIFSLILFVGLSFWSMSHIFGLQLTPLLATSAAFSVILGLALQDTLGNLFAGISLQIDHAFEIGDWLEIQNGPQKTIGKVTELSWRSTMLVGLSGEILTLPNKVMASSQISNYSPLGQPIMRSQIFRISHNDNAEKAKEIIEKTLSHIADVRAIPSPLAYINDVSESWISIKALYFIQDYGQQFIIGDKVFNFCLQALAQEGYSLATQVLKIAAPKPEA